MGLSSDVIAAGFIGRDHLVADVKRHLGAVEAEEEGHNPYNDSSHDVPAEHQPRSEVLIDSVDE